MSVTLVANPHPPLAGAADTEPVSAPAAANASIVADAARSTAALAASNTALAPPRAAERRGASNGRRHILPPNYGANACAPCC